MVAKTPNSLQQAIVYFSDPQNCHDFLVTLRWPDGVVSCPRCGSEHVTYLKNARVWKCYEKHSLAKFSLKTGTIFEDSPLGLDKWLSALWLVVNCKNGISSCEIARDLDITQKSAWFLAHRIRFALHEGSFDKMLQGEVEVDETFIGGKARNMHKDRKLRTLGKGNHGGPSGKIAIQGLLERHGKVRCRVLGNLENEELRRGVREHVHAEANLYSDAAHAYKNLKNEGYLHQFVDHAEKYVDGKVHTNGLENFWALLKRGINGTYISVEPFHLFRYVDEQAYRFNNREELTDGDRFEIAASQIVGKRLTWKKLTGVEPTTTQLN